MGVFHWLVVELDIGKLAESYAVYHFSKLYLYLLMPMLVGYLSLSCIMGFKIPKSFKMKFFKGLSQKNS